MASGYREYAAEGTLIAGGGAALLLQLADPVVASAVAAHSGYARDPVGRLAHTLRYVYAVSLGPDAVRQVAAERVQRAHAGIPGADDPVHQLWVAATLYRVGTQVHEVVFGRMSDELADEVYASSAALGTMLEVPASAWPADRTAFGTYWDATVAELDVGDDARAVANGILRPVAAPLWMRAAMPTGRTITAGLLPPRIREAYGFADRPRAFRRAVGVLRAAVRVTPRGIRRMPSRRLAG